MPREAAQLSPAEIIALINHSQLFTVVVEGPHDILVFRVLEEEFSEVGLNVITAGGRDALLETFRRRADLSRPSKAIFIADRDLWVFSSIPPDYQSDQLLFTEGYSIENDMFVDGEMYSILNPDERSRFDESLRRLCRWYALVVCRRLDDPDCSEPIDLHPNHVLDEECCFQSLTQLREGETFPVELYEQVVAEYRRLLRGKNLLHLFVKCATLGMRHDALLRIAAARRGANFCRLVDGIRSFLSLNVNSQPRALLEQQ